MTTENAKVGMRIYNRYRDLFGVIVSFGSDEEGTYAKVKYEWPVDPNAEPYKDPIYRLEPDSSVPLDLIYLKSLVVTSTD